MNILQNNTGKNNLAKDHQELLIALGDTVRAIQKLINDTYRGERHYDYDNRDNTTIKHNSLRNELIIPIDVVDRKTYLRYLTTLAAINITKRDKNKKKYGKCAKCDEYLALVCDDVILCPECQHQRIYDIVIAESEARSEHN